MEVFVGFILLTVAIEAITSIILCEDSIFHTMVWSKVQKGLENSVKLGEDLKNTGRSHQVTGAAELFYKLSKCNYCISFWISVALCPFVFEWNWYLPMAILASWRLSHMFDAVYRYYLVRSFVAGNADIEE